MLEQVGPLCEGMKERAKIKIKIGGRRLTPKPYVGCQEKSIVKVRSCIRRHSCERVFQSSDVPLQERMMEGPHEVTGRRLPQKAERG